MRQKHKYPRGEVEELTTTNSPIIVCKEVFILVHLRFDYQYSCLRVKSVNNKLHFTYKL